MLSLVTSNFRRSSVCSFKRVRLGASPPATTLVTASLSWNHELSFLFFSSTFTSSASGSGSGSGSQTAREGLNFVITPSEANQRMNDWANSMLLAPSHWKRTFQSNATAIHLPFYSFLLSGWVEFTGQGRYRVRPSESSRKNTTTPISMWSSWITFPTSGFRVDSIEVNSYASFGFDHLKINELGISFYKGKEVSITSPIQPPKENTHQYEVEDWSMDLETGWEVAWRGQLRNKFREIAEAQLRDSSVLSGLSSAQFDIEVKLLHLKFNIQRGTHRLLFYPIYAHRHIWPPLPPTSSSSSSPSAENDSWSNEENEFVCIVDGINGKVVGDRTYDPFKVSIAALVPSIGVWFLVPFWLMGFIPKMLPPFLIGGGVLTAIGVGQYYRMKHSKIVGERIRTRNRAFAFKNVGFTAEFVWHERQRERETQWEEEREEEEHFKRTKHQYPAGKKPKRDYYELLNVPRTATPREIRNAFLEQAKRWHPDHNANDPKASKMFRKLNKAYRILSDPELRQLYDLHGHDAVRSH